MSTLSPFSINHPYEIAQLKNLTLDEWADFIINYDPSSIHKENTNPYILFLQFSEYPIGDLPSPLNQNFFSLWIKHEPIHCGSQLIDVVNFIRIAFNVNKTNKIIPFQNLNLYQKQINQEFLKHSLSSYLVFSAFSNLFTSHSLEQTFSKFFYPLEKQQRDSILDMLLAICQTVRVDRPYHAPFIDQFTHFVTLHKQLLAEHEILQKEIIHTVNPKKTVL